MWSAALLLSVLLLLLAMRLPWNGDLGIHAATIERLRADLIHPGGLQVDADVDSPYYSPWTVLLGIVAKATGLGTFKVLRLAALTALPLLLTGVWHFTRTLSTRRVAPALALLCLLLLWGPPVLAWSGFLNLGSLAFTLAYPSTFVLGLSFHFWALLTKALRSAGRWPAFLGLGLMWAVILLSHQFTGLVATFGALGVLLAVRPWPAREVWLRLGAGIVLAVVVLALWPYYSFFSLFGVGGLEEIHRPLYDNMVTRFGPALIGVAALYFRWRRDRRDPLVIFFVLGTLTVVGGGVTGHWSWGRALPAAVIPAQLAAALAVADAGSRRVRNVLAAVLGGAMLLGVLLQAFTFGYVIADEALPPAVRHKSWSSVEGYAWMTPWVQRGDTVMTTRDTSLLVPAYGAYTVAPGYPDLVLPDEKERQAAVARFFAPHSSRADRLDVLHRYHVRWLLRRENEGGLPADDPALHKTTVGPGGQALYRVVG
ncbi:hypothetical protein EOT10_35615 [Streptomyces antnestii]|uniref:Glycosyltransferase RgtA/B/C/D-like domain-containing protein n=1 Tax=Streptomyces antnestii TaxID=2494256 RepID=A0A3S2V8X9_9ACTN|nr:hypothetical protein EOT10_35615 [Streptomyces sp. San01]